jgi:hypothetical protein
MRMDNKNHDEDILKLLSTPDLLVSSNEREWDGRGMWHAWGRLERCTGFEWEKPKGKRPL